LINGAFFIMNNYFNEVFLNQKLERVLKPLKKKITFNEDFQIDLTDNEIYLLRYVLKNKDGKFKNLIFFPISERLHLDFIGWESENDVLLCKSTKKSNSILFHL